MSGLGAKRKARIIKTLDDDGGESDEKSHVGASESVNDTRFAPDQSAEGK
jgi:hypothetical protein